MPGLRPPTPRPPVTLNPLPSPLTQARHARKGAPGIGAAVAMVLAVLFAVSLAAAAITACTGGPEPVDPAAATVDAETGDTPHRHPVAEPTRPGAICGPVCERRQAHPTPAAPETAPAPEAPAPSPVTPSPAPADLAHA